MKSQIWGPEGGHYIQVLLYLDMKKMFVQKRRMTSKKIIFELLGRNIFFSFVSDELN
jgi:hypothetical protein